MNDTYQIDAATLTVVTDLRNQGRYAEAYNAIIDAAPITYSGLSWVLGGCGC